MRGEKSLLKNLVIGTLAAVCLLGTFSSEAPAAFFLVRSFTGGADDGSHPKGPLVGDGGILYGMTALGGVDDKGTIFKVNTDGTGSEVLVSLGEEGYAGSIGGLILDGSTLYGVVYNSSYQYKLFRVATDGSGFTILYSFSVEPTGYLTLYQDLGNSYLYGVTGTGGTDSKGTIFRLRTNGTDYETLYNFVGGTEDGEKPVGSLTLSGATFYGETLRGGANSFGTLFKIGANGSLYQCLYSFTGLGATDRAGPNGFLTLSGSTFYGMTAADSTSNHATIFRINTDGTGFQTLYTFTWSTIDGPYSPLVILGSTLYGGNPESGSAGTVFRINTDGTGYHTMHDFLGGTTDGGMASLLNGFLLPVGSTLYGVTWQGGSANAGVLFSITTGDIPSLYPLLLQ
ncbi:MAG: choice-of-anchor tandem repeat GloVer-containing protein [Syntrophobacteraceae bacterium]